MLINFIKSLRCKVTEHKLVYAGECPFTGSSYDFCEFCNSMIPRQVAA